jgi:metal iron transporter
MFTLGTDAGEQAVVQSSPEVIENPVSATVQELDVSSDEKKGSNVEVLETSDSVAESVVSTQRRSAQQIVGARLQKWGAVLLKFARFTGPGALISVAYVDPDNFQTALDAGAQFQFKLLFITLLGVLMAIFLQVGLSQL